MAASDFVRDVQEGIRKELGPKTGGWTNVDSLLICKIDKAFIAIEYKDYYDLDAEKERRKFAWQKDVYRAALADTTIALAIVCHPREMAFEVQAINEAGKDFLGGEWSRTYTTKRFEGFREFAARLRRLDGD